MPEEVVPSVAADSPPPDVTPAPSAEPVQPVEPSEPTPPLPSQAPPVEEAKIPLSRLNEVIEQRKAAEAREARLLEALQQVRQPAPPAQPSVNFWEGRTNHPDPATAQYWQQQKQMFDLAKQEARQEVLAELEPVKQAMAGQLAAINTKEFRRENPEVKPGSEEERLVVAYMNGQMDGIRHPIESAKRNALYDRLEAENRALKGKQSSVPTKVAANVSEPSSGIPASAGLPGKPGDWRENVRSAFRKGGGLAEVLNAAGARRVEP